MHFRTRNNNIQVIRTTYDSESKGGKSEVLGTIPRKTMTMPEELAAKLSEEETAEVARFIESAGHLSALREEVAAKTLAETIELATRYVARADEETIEQLAVQINPALRSLKKRLGSK
jgi:hypothetical protein